MQDVGIYGCGGLGQLARDILLQAGRFRPRVWFDSDRTRHGSVVDGLPVAGGLGAARRLIREGLAGVLVAIGDNRARVAVAEELLRAGARLISAWHPLASISPSAQVAGHTILGPRVMICVNARVGAHSILSAGVIADHDTQIGVGCHLHPAVRLAGGVRLDDLVTVGIGACLIPGRRVCREAHVYPGSVVIRDVAAHRTVAGVPAVAVESDASPARVSS